MRIYVGNLSRTASEDELRKAFEAHGEVASVAIIKDKFSGECRGFGFIEMTDDTKARAAIAAMSGTTLGGQSLNVNEAKPRVESANRW